ncbi:hypothetical protein V494_02728 [Pseudogymnoascus sp. VKM F-4513 (FW-928)]|nr:hypothetical protein V494_02728 [Pseudogymnoascus sp. VKM F-4513 (FW-928)]
MSSHNWPSVQIGQSQYPPFNPNTASYTSEDTQASTSDLTDLAVPSPTTTYHLNPEHDVNGTGGMIGLTLEQYKAGRRVSSAPSAPPATRVNNKRRLSHEYQVVSSPSNQSGDNSGNHQPKSKKRARKASNGNATPPISRSRISTLGESVFSPEDFASGLEHFKKISIGQSLEGDDLRKMRDFLTWSDDEQRKWLAKLSPEQFGVVLFAEKQDLENQKPKVSQPNIAHATQPQTHGGALPFRNQLQQGNGVHNGFQDLQAQNMMGWNNLSGFNQQSSPLAHNANFQQMAVQNPQGQSVQFGTHIPSYIVGPNGQLLPQQQNVFGNMPAIPNCQSAAYQQQIMVNGQLMNVALQPAFGGHQGGHFNAHQSIYGAHAHVPQQYGTNVNHTFNSMGQQNSTVAYSLPSGGQPNNTNQGANFVLPTLSHASRVAEAQLRAATMRRQHAELRARGLPVPVPNHPKGPPLVASGPGLGNLPGMINTLPPAPRSCLVNAFEGVNWEKDPEKEAAAKGATASSPNNFLGGQTPTGDGFPMKFADISGSNPVFLSQVGNATLIDHSGPTHNTTITATSGAVGHHGANGPAVPFYQVQLPNSAGQLSIGPNAHGSTSPAGSAKGANSKTSPKSKKPTKKPSVASSAAIANVANALFPSSSGSSTTLTTVDTTQPNAPGYSHGSLSLGMPSAVEASSTKLAFPSLPSPELSPVTNSSSSRLEPSGSEASMTTTAEASQLVVASLELSESNTPTTSALLDTPESSAIALLEYVQDDTVPASPGRELTAAEFDELFDSVEIPELEPSTPNEAATPEDSQPTDFSNDSLGSVFSFTDTPGLAPSGEYTGVSVYDETQPVGLGFDMTVARFDPMAATNFADMDVTDMGFDDWDDFDPAQ